MNEVILPARIDGEEPSHLHISRQVTLVGANGSGKTRFMHDLINRYSDKSMLLSAVQAFYPEREESQLPGSIDAQYRTAVASGMSMRTDAKSELDKVISLLLNDEFKTLLSAKTRRLLGEGEDEHIQTRLDKLIRLWQKIFPGNQVLHETGNLMFANSCGDNVISPTRLSSGEKAVLYYIAGVLYARPRSMIFIDSPTLFLHPSLINTIWNAVEGLRPDCTFFYNTNDVEFVNSRTENICVWIRRYAANPPAWDYEILSGGNYDEQLFIDLIGTRKPVMFIEGDATHSIDAKLYPLVFPEYTVRPLGSCDKVIESTRTFNDLKPLHHLTSMGIVDRDRRTVAEVEYLRRKNILVPEVAEIENLFLIEGVVRTMARRRGKNPERVFNKVRDSILRQFETQYREQALMHVRHKVKREVECKIDGRFRNIGELETHLRQLPYLLNPGAVYNQYEHEFADMVEQSDYASVLRVFNHKPMLGDSGVAGLLGYSGKDMYIADVLNVLKGGDRDANVMREAIKYCFRIDEANHNAVPNVDKLKAKPQTQPPSVPKALPKNKKETPSHALRRRRHKRRRQNAGVDA